MDEREATTLRVDAAVQIRERLEPIDQDARGDRCTTLAAALRQTSEDLADARAFRVFGVEIRPPADRTRAEDADDVRVTEADADERLFHQARSFGPRGRQAASEHLQRDGPLVGALCEEDITHSTARDVAKQLKRAEAADRL